MKPLINTEFFDYFKTNYIREIDDNTAIWSKLLDYFIFASVRNKDNYSCKISLEDICKYEGASYSTLNKALRGEKANRTYIIYDTKYTLCSSIAYSNGKIDVKFTKEITPYIDDLKNFISYKIEHLFLFKHKFTNKLYKLFYFSGKNIPNIYSLDKLRNFLLPDETIYPDWREFNRKVLRTAKDELDKLSSDILTFEYKPILSGKGGKVDGIEFFVSYNGEKNNFPREIKSTTFNTECFVGYNFSKKQIKELSRFVENEKDIDYIREIEKMNIDVMNDYLWVKYLLIYKWIFPKENDSIQYLFLKLNNEKDFDITDYQIYECKVKNEFDLYILQEFTGLLIKRYLRFNVKWSTIELFCLVCHNDLFNIVEKIQLLGKCDVSYVSDYIISLPLLYSK